MKKFGLFFVFNLLLLSGLVSFISITSAATLDLVSIGDNGSQTSTAEYPDISSDGRYLVFYALLTKSNQQVIVRYKDAATTSLVSRNTTGQPSNNGSDKGTIAPNAQFVTYKSNSSDIIPNGNFTSRKVFRYDTNSEQNIRVTTDINGNPEGVAVFSRPSISDDGRFVVYHAADGDLVTGDNNGHEDVFLTDTVTGSTTRISIGHDGSQGDGRSFLASISADGNFITYVSGATNILPNGTSAWDVYVYDRNLGTTSLITIGYDGTNANSSSAHFSGSNQSAPAISADGRFIAFSSYASNLVPNDTNGLIDVFLYDQQTGSTSLASISNSGAQPNNESFWADVSDDGRYVVFNSSANNLYPGDTIARFEVFVRDMQEEDLQPLLLNSSTFTQGLNTVSRPAISGDGRYVVFRSGAFGVMPNDTNNTEDIYRASNPLFPNIVPTIALIGSSTITVTEGGTYVDLGATANDAEDGDITANIVVGGDTVDTNTPGTYVITYNVTDSGGLQASEVTRTVIVEAAPGPDFSNVALLGINSAWLKKDSQLLSGDVVINSTSSGPFLNANVHLSVGVDVIAASGTELIADSMRLKNGSSVFDVSHNSKVGNGVVNGIETTPLTLPVFSSLPTFNTATVGTTTIKANSFATTSVDAGNYDKFIARATSTVIFTGGVYHFADVTFRRDSKIYFGAPTEIRITDKLNTNQNVIVEGTAGSGVQASDIFFYVEGINGTSTGALNDDRAAVDIGVNNSFSGNVYAPNGRVHVKNDSDVTGALFARDLEIGVRSDISGDSGF